jgi:hypothetical protein
MTAATTAAARGLLSSGRSRSRWAVAADLVDPPGLNFQREPARWVEERAHLELWSAQHRIMQSVRDHRQTVVRSCHEIGKSFTAALVATWWIDVHPPGTAFVVTTAPSDKQVKAILWREINRLHARIGLAGRTNLGEWYIGKELVAFGRKPSDYDPAAFSGLHAEHMLVIIDEGCGVPKSLFDGASSLIADEGGKILVIGNPDSSDGEFFQISKPGSGWNVIKVGYRDTPNFTDEVVSPDLRRRLISRQWVEERELAWGRESAIFQSKVDGEFPKSGTDGVVPLGWAEACRWLEYPTAEPVEGGIDVGAGGDRTVLRERRGMRAGREFVFTDPDPMKSVALLVEKINEWGLTKVKVDPIGIGWGLLGRLRELSSKHNPTSTETTHAAEVLGVNFAESPTPGTETRFLNKRAEVWWTVGRELSRLKQWDLSDVDEDVLAELCAPRYVLMDSKGKVKIEAKAEVIKRTGRSPDRADALLLAFVETDLAGAIGGGEMPAVDLMRDLTPGGWSAFG